MLKKTNMNVAYAHILLNTGKEMKVKFATSRDKSEWREVIEENLPFGTCIDKVYEFSGLGNFQYIEDE